MGYLEFWDLNPDLSALHEEFDIAELERLPRLQPGIGDGFPVDESAVSGVAVSDPNPVFTESDLAVFGGDGGVLDLEIVTGAPSELVQAEFKLDDLVGGIL